MSGLNNEASIQLGDRIVRLKLTLGALAELEEVLDVETIADLASKLIHPSASQLISILQILANAAGEKELESIRHTTVNLTEVVGAIATLFKELIKGELPGKSTDGSCDGPTGLG